MSLDLYKEEIESHLSQFPITTEIPTSLWDDLQPFIIFGAAVIVLIVVWYLEKKYMRH